MEDSGNFRFSFVLSNDRKTLYLFGKPPRCVTDSKHNNARENYTRKVRRKEAGNTMQK
jgi:hypothetical protein